jgi:hypothetical protein
MPNYKDPELTGRIGEYVRQWLTWVRSGCLEHVWDELLVGVMRSYDFPGLVAGVCTDVLFSGAPWDLTEIRINLKTRSDLAPRKLGKGALDYLQSHPFCKKETLGS